MFVVCRTSNPSSADLQDTRVQEGDEPVYMRIARRANQWQRDYTAQVGLVVGATRPRELGEIRGACPKLPILLPGVGAQAGDVEASVENGIDEGGNGLLVSSSRGIIYAGSGADFAERARDAAIPSVIKSMRTRAKNRSRVGVVAQRGVIGGLGEFSAALGGLARDICGSSTVAFDCRFCLACADAGAFDSADRQGG